MLVCELRLSLIVYLSLIKQITVVIVAPRAVKVLPVRSHRQMWGETCPKIHNPYICEHLKLASRTKFDPSSSSDSDGGNYTQYSLGRIRTVHRVHPCTIKWLWMRLGAKTVIFAAEYSYSFDQYSWRFDEYSCWNADIVTRFMVVS